MAKLDEYKERIAFSTKLFFVLAGLVAIIIGGTVNLYLSERIDEVFWIGIFVIMVLSYFNFLIFIHIKNDIKDIGKL